MNIEEIIALVALYSAYITLWLLTLVWLHQQYRHDHEREREAEWSESYEWARCQQRVDACHQSVDARPTMVA